MSLNESLKNENLKYETFEKGEVLFKEGEATEAFFIVVSGRVACAKNKSDRMIVFYIAEDKELVGEDSVLGNLGEHEYGAVALETTKAARIESSDVYSVIDSKSEWVKNILENLSDKINHTTDLISERRIEDDRLSGGETLSEELTILVKNSLS